MQGSQNSTCKWICWSLSLFPATPGQGNTQKWKLKIQKRKKRRREEEKKSVALAPCRVREFESETTTRRADCIPGTRLKSLHVVNSHLFLDVFLASHPLESLLVSSKRNCSAFIHHLFEEERQRKRGRRRSGKRGKDHDA